MRSSGDPGILQESQPVLLRLMKLGMTIPLLCSDVIKFSMIEFSPLLLFAIHFFF